MLVLHRSDTLDAQTPGPAIGVHSCTQVARNGHNALNSPVDFACHPSYKELCAFSRAQASKHLHQGHTQLGHVYARTLGCGYANESGVFHCRARSCELCCLLRQGQILKRYNSWVKSWRDPCLLTLTRESVARERIGSETEHQKREHRLIHRKIAERERTPVAALRKVEVDYNIDSGLYHPHLHILVDGVAIAERVKDEWLSRHRETASDAGQHVLPLVPCKTARNGLAYIAKPLVQLRSVPGKAAPPLEAINAIHEAMRGKRVLQPYGRFKSHTAPC